jgi:hypothetical protein
MDDPERRSALKLKGLFKTISEGRHPATCNCFCFPLDGGAWRVYRFSPGTAETETWEQDGNGWTNCFFNKTPDLNLVAKAGGGVEAPNGGGYVFPTAGDAAKVIKALGQAIAIPEHLQNRETRLKPQKDGRVVIAVKKANPDEAPPQGWLNERGRLTRVLAVKAEVKALAADDSYSEYDKIVRALVSPTGKRAGWVGRTKAGYWSEQPKDDIKSTLIYYGRSKPEVETIVGAACSNPWKLVSLPFQPEYPGDRQWNKDAAQYRYTPAELRDNEAPCHPHWDMVLKHCFGDLDEAIKELSWAQRANIRSGAEYGLMWAACMLRDPFQPLPYLFFYGEQNCGKSSYHEALELLMTTGVASADRAIKNQNDFNGELAGAILAYIEETDISQAKGAYNKIKDWVTNPTLWIRKMRTDAYPLPNTLHFVQCANAPGFCPIFPGDTRITMIYVPPIPPDDEIPRMILKERLQQEAPHFMRTLMDLTLPSIEGRLRLPVVDTHNKYRAQENNREAIDQFILENCFALPGEKILFSEFFDRFQDWLAPEEKHAWTRRKVSKSLPHGHPSGVHTDNKKFIANLSWEPKQANTDAQPLIVVNGRLKAK